MARKRTRKQKAQIVHSYGSFRQRVFETKETGVSSRQVEFARQKPAFNVLSLYHYDPKYILQDLRRTVIISVFVLALQVGLYFWLQ
jgi:hypothetical protein